MAISDTIQTLSAAFSLGILLQAAITAFLLYLKGHETKLSQDRRRLVLVVFLLFAALWAQLDFISLLIPTSRVSACRASTIISSLFDQSARVAIGAYLLFSIGHGTKSTSEKYALGGLVGIRIVAGVVLAILIRPQFAPLCIARSSSTPAAVIPVSLDVIIIGVLAIRILQIGLMRNGSSQGKQGQNKALTFVTIGFTIWSATSVPMELGLSYIILLVRTGIPATGLTILINMLTLFPGALISSQWEDDTVSEAQSPFRPDPPRSLGDAYNNSNDRSGSPVVHVGYGKNGRLFVTNPSDTPRDSPTGPFQIIKGEEKGKGAKGRLGQVDDLGGESSRSGVSTVIGAAPAVAFAFGSTALTTPVPAPSTQQKKSLFSRSKASSRPSIQSRGISHPVLDESSANSPGTPFARMETVDLETAAVNDRIRRENAVTRMLQNPRSAPLPPTADSGLIRSTSTKRKEVPKPNHEAMPSITSSAESIISSDISTNRAIASSISSSLSPNRDEVRRRSPRHATLEEKQTYQMPPPLQTKLAVGLPSGPRPNFVPMKQQILAPKSDTVMLLNDIVYDHPDQVNSLMNFTGGPIIKTKDLDRDLRDSDTIPATSLLEYQNTMSTIRSMESESSVDTKEINSIMERPRPYKKDRVKSRGLFPRDISEETGFNRRRSKSTGSLVFRKSMLISNPGSPTNLPTLPSLPLPRPPPTSAASLAKLLPKNTLGMTADEKISMLFPAPPGIISMPKRRSSVPSILSMLIDDTVLKSPLGSPLPVANGRMLPAAGALESPIERRETYRFSVNTYRNITKTIEGENEPPRLPTSISASSPHPHLLEIPAYSSKDLQSAFAAAITSRNPNVIEPIVVPPPKPTVILRKPLNSEYEDEVPTSPEELEDDDDDSIMFELKEAASEDDKDSFLFDDEESEDEEHEIETPTEADDTSSAFQDFPWHRRIGDDLPTFSDRGDQSRPRSMPPPPPLLLNPIGRNAAVIVRNLEPEPVDSPSQAIAEIQAQLKRFEERDRASVGSLIRKFPSDGSINYHGIPADNGHGQLLANLEKEMGLQKNVWMEMQHNYDRDSTGSILTPLTELEGQVRPTQSRELWSASSISRRPSPTTSLSAERVPCLTTSTQNQRPKTSRDGTTIWQQSPREAQDEYAESTSKLQRRGSRNFLSSELAVQASMILMQSNSNTEFKVDAEEFIDDDQARAVRNTKAMWQLSGPVLEQKNSLMWVPPATLPERSATPECPALSLRPTQYRDLRPLSHSSSSLWRKPANSGLSATRPIVGLWGSRTARPKSIKTRSVTQRPARKSKRMTLLPDIVESPSPLPHKRDTLGLYQFPWGEKSESAVYRPNINQGSVITQTTFNPVRQARGRNLESKKYSSGFFEDYDDGNFHDEEIESDDDFDESTLWEIASLLKTQEGFASKNSLLPQSGDITDDYEYDDYDEEFDDGPRYMEDRLHFESIHRSVPQTSSLWIENNESNNEMKVTGLAQPPALVWNSYIPKLGNTIRPKPKTEVLLAPLASKQLWEYEQAMPERHTYCLWNPDSKMEQAPGASQSEPPATLEEVIRYAPLPRTVFVQPAMWNRSKTPEQEPENKGLFVPDHRRSVYRTTPASPAARDTRVQRTSTLNVPSLESTDLWVAPKSREHHVSWIEKSVDAPIAVAAVVASSTAMWTAPSKAPVISTTGLFSPGSTVTRTSEMAPAAQGMIMKPCKARTSLPPLTSRHLWRSDNLKMVERDWISESSVRPTSPSVYSISSGLTSPASPGSDRSSIKSVASTSTKASSIWSTISTAATAVTTKPGWTVPKRKKALPMPSMPEKKDEEGKNHFTLNLPAHQSSRKLPLSSTRRESKVLANAAMFESRAKEGQFNIARMTRLANRESILEKKYTPPPTKPVYVPLRQQFRPTVIANWDAALQEAIVAGLHIKESKHTGLVRRKITSAEWDSALSMAISQSQPRLQRPQATKDMWIAALKEAMVQSRTNNNYMWYPVPAQPAIAKSILMWQVPASSSHTRPSIFNAVKGETLRKAKPSRIASLERLTTASFWKKEDRIKSVAQNWLHTSKARAAVRAAQMSGTMASDNPSAFTWTKPAVIRSSEALIWSKPTKTEIAPQNIFGDAASQTLRKKKSSSATPLSLPKLKSKQLFDPLSGKDLSDVHWLYVSSKTLHSPVNTASFDNISIAQTTPLSPALSQSNSTWMPPSNVEIQISEDFSMWAVPNFNSYDRRPSLFSELTAEPIKKARLSRSAAELPKLEAQNFWQLSSESSREVNWIKASTKAPLAAASLSSISSSSLTWTSRDISATPPATSGKIWDPSSDAPNIFANPHKEAWARVQRSVEPATGIDSFELWRPSRAIPVSAKNWLIERRCSRVEFRY